MGWFEWPHQEVLVLSRTSGKRTRNLGDNFRSIASLFADFSKRSFTPCLSKTLTHDYLRNFKKRQ